MIARHNHSYSYFSVLREEDKSTNLWFSNRYGGFEEMKEDMDPQVVDIPELEVFDLVYNL